VLHAGEWGGGEVGVSGSVPETTELLLVAATHDSTTTHREHRAFRVACSRRVHCANAFRVGSRNP
jgi:hypothetical protein